MREKRWGITDLAYPYQMIEKNNKLPGSEIDASNLPRCITLINQNCSFLQWRFFAYVCCFFRVTLGAMSLVKPLKNIFTVTHFQRLNQPSVALYLVARWQGLHAVVMTLTFSVLCMHNGVLSCTGKESCGFAKWNSLFKICSVTSLFLICAYIQ